jgi:L-rhamnose mutarotase
VKKYCLTIDLYDDPGLIAAYDDWHKKVWPEVLDSITGSGIINMEIYRFASRLFMIVEADDNFSFEAKAEADANNPRVQEWENLMWNFQKPMPQAKPGEKWMLMDKIFELK